MSDEKIAIGIDLGTTNSVVALFHADRQVVEILSNKAGSNITPSWVAYEKGTSNVIVGKAAANRENYYHHTKRVIGQAHSEIIKDQNLVNSLPFSIKKGANDRVEIVSFEDGTELEPEQIAASILKEMKEIAEKRAGKPIRTAVVTVPAYFNNSQRAATEAAAKIAGLTVERVINEPTAAGMACNFHTVVRTDRDEDDRNVLVYDFGGGTLDISLLLVSEGTLNVESTKGDMMLGGIDLDRVILQMCEKRIQSELTYKSGGAPQDGDIVPPALQKMIRRSLRHECERAKIELSSALQATIMVNNIICDHEVFNDLDFSMEISRAEFEEAAQDIFERIGKPLVAALENAGMDAEEINDVVLMGGSTRIPFVRKFLKDFFPGANHYDKVNPDEGVAYGAALMAADLAGQLRGANDSFESLPESAESSEEEKDTEDVLQSAQTSAQDDQPPIQNQSSEVKPPIQNQSSEVKPPILNQSSEVKPPKPEKKKSERPKLKPVIVSDVLPQALGTDVMKRQEDGTKIVVSDKLLKASMTMPCESEVRTYRTVKDNQKRISVQVLQGDAYLAKDCHMVGKFWLNGIPEAPKGQQKVQVTFSVNANGICKVKAVAVDNKNNIAELEIDAKTLGLSDDRLTRLQQKNQQTHHLHHSDSSDEAD